MEKLTSITSKTQESGSDNEKTFGVTINEGIVSDDLNEHFYDDAGFSRGVGMRQLTMITFGAGIGTGIWVGSGLALLRGGPAGIAIAYTIMAAMVYLMYMSIGEMTTYKPINGFIRQSMEYVDEAWAFALGLNFVFDWIIVLPAEVTAALSVVKFWDNPVPDWAWLTIFLVLLILGNCFPIKIYGEIEYWMSSIKLIAIIIMIFFLLIATCGGVPGSVDHPGTPIGFEYWKNPGAFNYGFKGVCAAFVQAGFSFGGGEHIAIIAGEVKAPVRKNIKKSVAPVFYRMCLFFVCNIWLVTMNVPYNDPRLASGSGDLKSPFVIAIQRAGVEPLAHILNAFILLTVISCGNSGIYVASRSLVSLSDLKLVHPFFGKKDKHGRPVNALVLCNIIGIALTYINLSETGVTVYGWFSSLVSMANYITWFSIFLNLIRFRKGLKAQGIPVKSLPFINRVAPWGQYVGCVIIFVIIVFQGYIAIFPIGAKPSAKNFFASYLSVPLFVFEFLIYKIVYKTKFVKPEDMNFEAAKYYDALDDRERLEKELNPELYTEKKFYVRVFEMVFN